jgi:hypothetical protein
VSLPENVLDAVAPARVRRLSSAERIHPAPLCTFSSLLLAVTKTSNAPTAVRSRRGSRPRHSEPLQATRDATSWRAMGPALVGSGHAGGPGCLLGFIALLVATSWLSGDVLARFFVRATADSWTLSIGAPALTVIVCGAGLRPAHRHLPPCSADLTPSSLNRAEGEGPRGLEASDCRGPFSNQEPAGAKPTEANPLPFIHQAGVSVPWGPPPRPGPGGCDRRRPFRAAAVRAGTGSPAA